MKAFLPSSLASLLFLCACACPGPGTESPAVGGGDSPTDPGLDPGATPPAPDTPVASPPPDQSGRTPSVPASSPHYTRVEGTGFQNACSADSQCFVGGCSSEICSAEQGVSSTCIAPAEGWPTTGSTCGCVQGSCVWYAAGASTSPSTPATPSTPPPAAAAPGQGEKCGAGDACGTGLTCRTYYGIAGPRGPEFKTCEIPCADKTATCPAGQKCVTIADGPGQVCRP